MKSLIGTDMEGYFFALSLPLRTIIDYLYVTI